MEVAANYFIKLQETDSKLITVFSKNEQVEKFNDIVLSFKTKSENIFEIPAEDTTQDE